MQLMLILRCCFFPPFPSALFAGYASEAFSRRHPSSCTGSHSRIPFGRTELPYPFAFPIWTLENPPSPTALGLPVNFPAEVLVIAHNLARTALLPRRLHKTSHSLPIHSILARLHHTHIICILPLFDYVRSEATINSWIRGSSTIHYRCIQLSRDGLLNLPFAHQIAP